MYVTQKFSSFSSEQKAYFIIQCILIIIALPCFIVAFLFNVSTKGSTLSTDYDPLTTVLENTALAGSITVIVVNLFGAAGSLLHNKVMAILYIFGCIAAMIILFVCGIVPLVSVAVLDVACASIDSCYECASSMSSFECSFNAKENDYNCYYYQSDYVAICGNFRDMVDVVVSIFFISGFLSFVNSILSCVCLSSWNNPSSTVVVLQQTNSQQTNSQQPYPQQTYPQQTYPQQTYPQQPYPQQPYPQQPYPQQPYPQQPYPQEAYPQQPYSQEPNSQQQN
jgi:hypothetical protein